MLGRLYITSSISPQHPNPLDEDTQLLLDSHRSTNTSYSNTISLEASLPITGRSLLSNTVNPTHASAPTDGTWDIMAAHEQQFCFNYGEVKRLIKDADRWIYPTDFDVNVAEARLDAKLKQDQRGPEELVPHQHASRAECNCSV